MTQARSTWWLWPMTPLLLVAGPTLILANAIDESVYERAWRTPKGLDDRSTVLMLAVVIAMAAGTMVVALAEDSRRARPGQNWPGLPDEMVTKLSRIYPWLIGLTLFGYAVWIGLGLSRGLSVADVQTVLATQDNFKLPIKSKLETLPGVTTLTQAAIPAAIVGVLLDAHRPSAAVRWAYRLTILLATARALMLAERLALAEIVVPILVLRAALFGHRVVDGRRLLVTLAPLFGAVLLLVGFAASEYSRSWNWYSSRTDTGFVDFASERLLGYYATSHNNGALLLNHGETVADIPYYTTTFVWQIPPGSQVGGELADDVSDDRRRVLHGFGNPEFNSPSGLSSVLIDFGTIGGLVFALALGMVVAGLHLSFLYGRILGLLLYPVAFTGLLELPRYLYWFQGRATPAIAFGLIAAVYLARPAAPRLRGGNDRRAVVRPNVVGTVR